MSRNSVRTVRHKAVAVAAAALALGSVVTTATAAQASTTQGYVNGFDDVTDDWGDEGLLSTTQHSNSGAVGIWQAVLYNDGFLGRSDVDCKFGPATAAATKKWQAKYLGAGQADGVVGNKTFGKASTWLKEYLWAGEWTGLQYDGTIDQFQTITFERNKTTGRYSFYKAPGVRVEGYYDSMGGC
ncbi:peptidoglycan-binding protein [Streptomyces sp. NPDC059104]|uniref:peptidoglycan-binding domain-containing protein n=1 Tax=Streptomyces sp. NPDC059104 TaxID=3346729 RepID=UPI0036ADF2DC